MKNLLILALFIFGTSFAFSQKYGYIDSDYILNKMPDYSEAKTKLDKLAELWKKEIEESMELVTRKKADYAREEVLLPDEEKTNRLTELTRLETETLEMQKLRFGVKGDYFSKRQELIKPIQDKVYDAMQKVASKRNYSFVFDKANQSNLVYADSKYDLSDEVLKELDIK